MDNNEKYKKYEMAIPQIAFGKRRCKHQCEEVLTMVLHPTNGQKFSTRRENEEKHASVKDNSGNQLRTTRKH